MVVNCTRTRQDVDRTGVYISPATGASNTYRPSRYFGVYYSQNVHEVANIEAVVEVNFDKTTNIRWLGGGGKESDYRQKAVEQAHLQRTEVDFPVQVFILGTLQATDFKKDGRAGTLSGTKYFDMSSLGVDTAGFLAMKLRGKKWSDFSPVEQKA